MLLWLVHMCVPTTPLLWSFPECAVILNKENRTSIPVKYKQNPTKSQAGRPKPGQPAYTLHQNSRDNSPGTEYTEPAHLQRGHGDWPQVQAGRPSLGLPAPPVGLSPRSSAWCWFDPSTTLSFLLSFKFALFKSNKIMNKLHRKSEIVSWKMFVLSFIPYRSTCLPWNTCLGSLAVLLIDPCDMMTWGCAGS